MVTVTLHKQGNQWVVVLPDEEIVRLGLDEGQRVAIALSPAVDDDERQRRINEIMDDVVVEYREAFEYLAR
jgi:antitoxin component of MazEF toxin-antitoxin module